MTRVAAALALLLLCAAPLAARAEGPFPWRVLSVARLPDLDAALQRKSGWTGGDGAHSWRLAGDVALWLYGDTFYGEVAGQRRVAPVMVHNSAAWRREGRFEFFPTRGDLLRPHGDETSWYWPGDGAMVGGRFLLFCVRVRHLEHAAFGFDFDWYGSDLLEIENPTDVPTRWRVVEQRPAPSRGGVHLGAACATDERWVYAWGVRPDDVARSLYLARRRLEGGPWEWSCPEGWRADGEPRELFRGAAPEMSVTPYRGGWLAVYTPCGLSPEVSVRWAPRPEGPWSGATTVYRAPEADQQLLVYGARAHPEMGGDGLVLTYNCNAPTPRRLLEEASAYAPRFIRLVLGRR